MTNEFTIPRFRPKRKNIQYGPAPKALVAAVRKELQRLIDLPDLDQNLGMIGRFANQADDMLMCVKSPEAVMKNEHGVTVPGVVTEATNAETYGASLIRQIMPALSNYQKAQQETPEALVTAIMNARRAGMTDVAAELEKKLLGKSLGGNGPVKTQGQVVSELKESYLSPPVASLLPKKGKTNGKTNGVTHE